MIASPSTKNFTPSTLLTLQQQVCAREMCNVRAHVHACWPYISHVYL
jgi:hypothetical protein